MRDEYRPWPTADRDAPLGTGLVALVGLAEVGPLLWRAFFPRGLGIAVEVGQPPPLWLGVLALCYLPVAWGLWTGRWWAWYLAVGTHAFGTALVGASGDLATAVLWFGTVAYLRGVADEFVDVSASRFVID